MAVELTAKQIEELLAKEEYKPIERINKKELTYEQRLEVNVIEEIVSFGNEAINLFESMMYELQTLPTQAQYVEAGLGLMFKWIEENKPDILPLSEVQLEACKLRLTRTYMSRVTEIHLEASIKEHLPHITIKKYPMLDSIMGVDLILEDDIKRYYVHVTSNTNFAQKMLKQKESRGGYKVGKAFITYARDFEGDLILKYDIFEESDSTMIINGFPLFKPDFIAWKLKIARKAVNIGEPLDAPYSKLQHFKDWAKHNLNMNIISL